MPIPCSKNQYLTMAQVQDLLRQVGWNENEIVTFSAVLKGESSLCPLAYNKTGEYSIGLAQINMQAHGTRFGTEQQLYNPITNLKAALILRNQQGLKAWGAYTHPRNNPRYKQFLPEAQAAYNNKTVIDNNTVNNTVNNNQNNTNTNLGETKKTDNDFVFIIGAALLLYFVL